MKVILHQETFCRKTGGICIERQIAPVRHADESGTIATKHESETYEPEENGTDYEIDEVLKQYLLSFLYILELCLADDCFNLFHINLSYSLNYILFDFDCKVTTFCLNKDNIPFFLFLLFLFAYYLIKEKENINAK